jgi:hypothetical protein
MSAHGTGQCDMHLKHISEHCLFDNLFFRLSDCWDPTGVVCTFFWIGSSGSLKVWSALFFLDRLVRFVKGPTS